MTLDLEALVVDSFAADAEGTELRGTVRGNGVFDGVTVRVTCFSGCGGATCDATGSPCVAC
ncbi:MAG TPA: hypothetical protein VGO89_10990 [Streptomyces sp.]|nr:hypothetical protein [Streptomyces sp.]